MYERKREMPINSVKRLILITRIRYNSSAAIPGCVPSKLCTVLCLRFLVVHAAPNHTAACFRCADLAYTCEAYRAISRLLVVRLLFTIPAIPATRARTSSASSTSATRSSTGALLPSMAITLARVAASTARAVSILFRHVVAPSFDPGLGE